MRDIPKTVLLWTFALLIAISFRSAHAEDAATTVDFSRDVRPILSDKCFTCHGPDENSREGDLRLDRREDAEPVLSRAAPEESELLLRISSLDADDKMPPADSKLKLSQREIDVLAAWIRQGAPFEQHWSFLPLGEASTPKVEAADWSKNAVDHFILARLKREGLAPSPQASKEKLIRRVTFDLIGLPPTLEEIDAFLADETEDAYEKLVDRLLAREEYGERMANHWLDVSRYSDTYGYQVDRDRFVWPWRDWVIKAFNDGMPYDQFITWQLAGDLFPEASDQQILATTFNRLHPQKVEGGSTPEEFRVEYVADRNHTFATAFLGLTLECARCHEHKFDPISQAEYYQLFAFFNSIDEAGLYSYHTKSVPTPTLLLTNDETQQKIDDFDRRIADAEAQSLKAIEARGEAFQAWLAERPKDAIVPGRIAHLHFENYKHDANQVVEGKVGKAVRLTGDDGVALEVGNFQRHDPFSVTLWMQTPDVKERAVVFHRSSGWTDAGSRGYQLLIEDGKLSASLIHFWPGNSIRVRTRAAIPTNEWLHVAVTYDGSSRASGLRVFVDGKPAEVDVVRDQLQKKITGREENITVGQRSRDRGFTRGLIDEFQVFDRQLAPIEVAQVHDGKTLAEALATPADGLTQSQRDELFTWYLATRDDEHQKRVASLGELREERNKLIDGIEEIMVMRELPEARPTHRLKRGAYDAPAERVHAKTPAALPPFPEGAPANRLGLARWLTDPSHPLTARVAVNRFWQMYFGQGLVRTPEDFGSQGEPPTHPELLDWLARDFIDHGWNMKRLFRQLVTSATYRQSTVCSKELRARDPSNILFARGPAYRLPAEMIRDNALAVSGLLVKKIGGPPVRPYEVEVSFKPMKRDEGEGLYRRSLYTFWKRTGPAPVMMAFDAAKRDVCVVKRERTSSPLQALVLLNDPQFVEAARMLAQRLIKKHGKDVEGVLQDMFRLLTSRRPSSSELEVLRQLFDDQRSYFEANVSAAEEFLKTGDAPWNESLPASRIAAAAVVASAIMNYDECVMKR